MAYFETKGTTNKIYTSTLKPYIEGNYNTNTFEYNNHKYNTTRDDVGVYTLYIFERMISQIPGPLDSHISSDSIRLAHYDLLNDNGLYGDNVDFNELLYKITYNKNNQAQKQNKKQTQHTNDMKYDPRVETNYHDDLMIILIKYILMIDSLDYMIIENPKKNSHNARAMITKVVNHNDNATIVIILKYTRTNYGVYLFHLKIMIQMLCILKQKEQ